MYKIITLDNGVRIAIEQLTFLRSVSFGIWVKNGSRYESNEVKGISHFIEHLLFKGTKNRTAKDIADQIDCIGGQINAFTAKECTCYYTKTLDTHLDIAVEILADMFFNSLFDEDEIKKECKVILEEISMYEDSPEDVCFDILHAGVFENSSLGHPILGTKDSITKFTSNTFKDYFGSRYTPENTVISIAGNFELDYAVDLVKKYFSNYINNDIKVDNIMNNKYKSVYVSKEKEVEQLHLNMAFRGVSLGTDEVYDLSVISTILGGGMSSKLFQKIREEQGLCYSVYSQSSAYKDIGIFSIYSALNPENAEKVVNIVTDEINIIKKQLISKELLNKTKEQIKSNYILSLESSGSRMHNLGKSLLLNNRILTSDQLIDKIDKVSLESLEKVVLDVFNFDNLSISAVGNINDTHLSKFIRS